MAHKHFTSLKKEEKRKNTEYFRRQALCQIKQNVSVEQIAKDHQLTKDYVKELIRGIKIKKTHHIKGQEEQGGLLQVSDGAGWLDLDPLITAQPKFYYK